MMAPENRKICMNAIFNKNKRPSTSNPKTFNPHHKNPNFTNPNNPAYKGGSQFPKKPKNEKKPYHR